MIVKRSALSRPEKQHRTKGNSMKRLTKSERRKQIRRFDAIRDDQINTTDIPEITEEQMRKGVVGRIYRPIKRPVTMRLDADVIAWLPDQSKPALAAGNAESLAEPSPGGSDILAESHTHASCRTIGDDQL